MCALLLKRLTPCHRTKSKNLETSLKCFLKQFTEIFKLQLMEKDTYRYFVVDNYLKAALDPAFGLFFIDTQRFARVFM
jgi:hypothetical protein